ncbi:MAG: stage II sporulation protein M [Pseudomonadota bacterium]
MSPAEFVTRHEHEWIRLDSLLKGDAGKEPQAGFPADFPALYRRVCRHLALAQDRQYPQDIVDRLNALALAGQQFLYRPRPRLLRTVAVFLAGGFAEQVRSRAGLFWLAAIMFYLPFAAAALATWASPELVYGVLPPESVAEFEEMYDADRRVIGYARESDDNLMMFGYYISNNIGIGFQTFAAGIVAGVGSLLILLSNGITIGTVAGYLTAQGHGPVFWQFVCGHSAFELNAIVLCGMTGLMLGRALVAPGRHRRRDALILAAREGVPILYGAAFMLFVAAIVEAFWSSQTIIPPAVKYAMAGLWWLLVILYFLRAGRRAS